MLDRFDWLRRSRTGAEFLATLRCFQAMPELFTGGGEFGPPFSALNGPCWRCWVYPRGGTSPRTGYCPICQAILDGAGEYGITSRYAAVIWGYVNRLPRSARAGSGTLGAYICDERHFLVAMVQQELKPWLQELLLYDGEELKGLLQVFPTVGLKEPSMGELLAHIVHREARFPPDRLRVSFFPALRQVFHSRTYEKEGVLTFEATEFLNTLELATVFRKILRPEEQKVLYKLLHTEKTAEVQFYWGRFLGTLNQEARDMLNAWGIREWSEPQVSLLYELVDYVVLD